MLFLFEEGSLLNFMLEAQHSGLPLDQRHNKRSSARTGHRSFIKRPAAIYIFFSGPPLISFIGQPCLYFE